jgi:UDP-glucose 4-epimerase
VSANPKLKELYFRVNRDLTIEAAKKAKAEGVRQFIFMSSLIVYGDSSPIGKEKVIRKDTIPAPANFYGESKLQAEEGIRYLNSENFAVVILRPPMIYGKGSKGNYPALSKYARKLPFFPNIANQRSVLHIDNLCEFIRLLIDNNEKGMFFPQNYEYVSTSEIVASIARAHGKKIRLTRFFNPAIRLSGHFLGVVNKAFGNMVCEKSMSEYRFDYRVCDFEESITRTET